MKSIGKPAKKKILVALLGMCVVASSYHIAQASEIPPGTVTAVAPSGSNTSSDLVWWFSPFWPFYYYSYYYYYYPYPYYYYYGGVVVVWP